MLFSALPYIDCLAKLPRAKIEKEGPAGKNESLDVQPGTPLPQTLVRIPVETKQENSHSDTS